MSETLNRISQRLVAVPPEAQRAKGIAASLAVRRYREGLTGKVEFGYEMLALGYTPDEIARYWLQALLEYETDFTMDLFTAYRDAYRKDVITEEEFRHGLESLGMVPERVDGWVYRENIRKMPTS